MFGLKFMKKYFFRIGFVEVFPDWQMFVEGTSAGS